MANKIVSLISSVIVGTLISLVSVVIVASLPNPPPQAGSIFPVVGSATWLLSTGGLYSEFLKLFPD